MGNNLRNFGLAFVGGILGSMAVSECGEEQAPQTTASIRAPLSPEDAEEVEKYGKLLRGILGAMHSDEPEPIDLDEFGVDLPLDENGNLPVGFTPRDAIRECIESSGRAICSDTLYDDTACSPLEGEGGNINVYYGFDTSVGYAYGQAGNPWNDYDVEQKGPYTFSLEVTDGNEPDYTYEVYTKDPKELEYVLTEACRDGLHALTSKFTLQDFENPWTFLIQEWAARRAQDMPEEVDAQVEFFTAEDFEVENLGGDRLRLSLPGDVSDSSITLDTYPDPWDFSHDDLGNDGDNFMYNIVTTNGNCTAYYWPEVVNCAEGMREASLQTP